MTSGKSSLIEAGIVADLTSLRYVRRLRREAGAEAFARRIVGVRPPFRV